MYDADIILCCGGRSAIKEFVNRYYLTDLQLFSKDDVWIYYSSSTRKEVIGSIEVKSPTMVIHRRAFCICRIWRLYGHNLLLLLLKCCIYQLAVLLEQFLSLCLAVLALILRHTLLNSLLESLDSVTTSITQ